MKKALKMIFLYLFLLIACTAIGTALYCIYLKVSGSVTGIKITLFDTDVLLKSLFYVAACVIIFIGPLVSFFCIRNNGGVARLITYIILSCLVWGLLLPVVIHFGKKYDFNNPSIEETENIAFSSNCFRKGEDKVYYFLEDLEKYETLYFPSAQAVVIDTDTFGTVGVKEIRNNPGFELNVIGGAYRDVIVSESFKEEYVNLPVSFHTIIGRADNALDKGWTFCLGFLSLGLLLCSLYGFSHLFVWKLINSGFIVSITAIILFVNTFCTTSPFFSSLMEKINSTSFFAFLGQYMDQPFIVFLNLVFSIISILIGVIGFIHRKKKGQPQ